MTNQQASTIRGEAQLQLIGRGAGSVTASHGCRLGSGPGGGSGGQSAQHGRHYDH